MFVHPELHFAARMHHFIFKMFLQLNTKFILLIVESSCLEGFLSLRVFFESFVTGNVNTK